MSISALFLFLCAPQFSPVLGPGFAAQAVPPLTMTRVASGLAWPVFVTSPPGDLQRLFILEFNTGRIRILKNGALLTTPFLDIGSLVTNNTNFGLLGLAFHPNYAVNGWFYVQYVNNSSQPRVVRYTVSADPDVANAASAQSILTLPAIVDHQGGTLAFGPNDGYLYVAFGDGQEADPNNNAQNDGTLLGKMVRLDVNTVLPYSIPPTNPFVGPGNPLDEIWAKGLREPFRFTFDRATGDLWLGDVGQSQREELDFQPANHAGGRNYGWRLKEGKVCFNPPSSCNPGGLTPPIFDYTHVVSGCRGCITGGSVYRGSAIPGLSGTYFFADFCTGKIAAMRYNGSRITELKNVTAALAPPGGFTINQPTSIGEDGAGELYLTDFDGDLYKLVPR
jgi:glucose/arabinose dehydrogenase